MNKKLVVLLTAFFLTVSFSYAAIIDGMAGFATQNGGTTGGAGGAVVTVNNLTDLINAVKDSDPTPRIVYIQGEINSGDDKGRQVKIGNNKTIIGCGSGAFLNGVLFGINGKTNIIIRNIKFTMLSITNTTDPAVYSPLGDEGRPQILTNGGDCISIQGASSNIWIDHCEFYQADPHVQTNQDLYDGLLDVKNGSQYITVSWCYFHDHHKCHLVGSSDSDNFDRKITFHHNYYRNIKERMPSYRFGTAHVFNNYFFEVISSGVNARMEACLRVENNYMEDSNDPIVTKNSTLNGFWDLRSGFDNSENSNIYINSTGSRPTVSTCTLNLPYSYTAYLDAAASVKSEVMTNAGVGKITVSCGAPPPTNTITAVITATRTRTNTVVPTATRTATVAVPSATFTGTRTITQTSTRTATVALPSATFTSTSTVIPTSTRTSTVLVSSATSTATGTAISTATRTVTIAVPSATFTATSTEIPTSTRTATVAVPSVTFTATSTTIPAATSTATVTVPSATNTMTATTISSVTVTSTNTAVPTATSTTTNTTVPSATITRTNTTIPSATLTNTAISTSTPSVTLTTTPQPTATMTPTATISWGEKFGITYILPYPNPLSGSSPLNIKVTLTQPAQQLKVRLYTASFRRILEYDCGSSAVKDTVVTIPQERLSRLASGAYYLVVTGVTEEGVKAVSKPAELIIIR